MMSGFDHDTPMSPIDPVGALSNSGRHVRPESSVFHTPPVCTPTKKTEGCVGIPTPATVRLARNGPIRR
jgi:hypothetical protein